MKALIYNGPWDMTLTDLPDPQPKTGEALLKVEAVGICGSDVHGFTGESGRRAPGMVMGHEVTGRIIGLGDGADDFAVGDRVAIFNIHTCGQCEFCLQGKEQICATRKIVGVNAGQWGAMAEYLACPTSMLFKVDPDLDPAIPLLAEPIGVATHAIGLMDPAGDHVIAIVGSGMIGVGLAIALHARGIRHVFALDKLDDKLQLIGAFGAHPINVDTDDPLTVIKDQTGKEAADGTFEAVGLGATVQAAFDLTAINGTMVIIGNLDKQFTLPMQLVTWRETTIRGSYGFARADFAAAVDLINRKSLNLDPLITGSCTLAETPDVLTRLAKGELQATKMVIRP